MLLLRLSSRRAMLFFFFNDTATTEIYTLSLHDALPIFGHDEPEMVEEIDAFVRHYNHRSEEHTSELHHITISYAVFCLKKKKIKENKKNKKTEATNENTKREIEQQC